MNDYTFTSTIFFKDCEDEEEAWDQLADYLENGLKVMYDVTKT